ncbi:metallophosphoesterase family protein [Lentilactobacillus kosonis]|uniref:Calcineurin-like phosphoesterase domain-containing protein n=1 Tax=Lentilactobacillus kosonis TaxID=2810561 RepID=A0A401FJI0_9LACO|nr:metallophosphoesterase [Lentilactobacillus kosonis]GAY72391.1 hypothetical protein NBRC111893_537 [Lentilactobacillus kosonis]
MEKTATIADYRFPMNKNSWLQVKKSVSVYTQPSFKKEYQTDQLIKSGQKVNYQAKVKGTDNDTFWAELLDGSFLPMYAPRDLRRIVKLPRPGRYERIGNILDQNAEQPWENIWPYSAKKRGKKINIDGKKTGMVLSNVTAWEKSADFQLEDFNESFKPTNEELAALQKFDIQVRKEMKTTDKLIAYVTDTHIDTYQTPASAAVFRSLRLMSYYADHYGVDLVVHGGDLNDGNKPIEISLRDVIKGVKAIKEANRPYIILNGNHDDNSGYARDNAGYLLDQIITNQQAWEIRQSPDFNLHDNGNHAVYGTFDIPESPFKIVILDGFDQADAVPSQDGQIHFNSFRHGYTHYSAAQIDWLKDVLANSGENQQLLFINHIAVNGVDTWVNTFDMGGKRRSQPSYLKTLFENNEVTNVPGVRESRQVFDLISDYQQSTGNVIGYIAGHTHQDNFAYKNGIWFVTQTSGIADRGDGAEKYRNPQRDVRSLTGINANAWSVIRLSSETKTVNQFRFGWRNNASFLDKWHY